MFSTRTAIFFPMSGAWPIIPPPRSPGSRSDRSRCRLIPCLRRHPEAAGSGAPPEAGRPIRCGMLPLDLPDDGLHEPFGDFGMPGRDEIAIDHDVADLL